MHEDPQDTRSIRHDQAPKSKASKNATVFPTYVFPKADNGYEQYRTIVEETARISDRRHNIGNIYLSVNGILTGAAALVFQQAVLNKTHNPLSLPELLMPLLLVVGGIVLCYQWTRLL